MPLNTVLGPVSIDNSGFVNGLPTNIAALSDGSFALTVLDSVTSNAVNSVVYTAQGVLVGGGAAMPPADPQSESYPDIAGLANGGYALAWEEWFTVNGLYQPLVYTAVYDAQGNQISTPIEASSGLSYSELPEATALNGGGYALTWHAANSNPDLTGDLWTRFFDSAGQPVTAAINLTGPLGGYDQLVLAGAPIGVLANGNVVYSWRSGPFGQGEVYTAIYSADGTNVVGPTKLTNTPSLVESDVQLAVLSGGHYALSWQGDSTSTFQSQIYTAVYDSAGNQILAPLVVSGGIGPEIVALSNGEYAIAWVNGDIYTAVFNAQGALVSGIVNLTNTGGQLVGDVEIAALQSGYYALAWAGGVNALPDVFTAVVDAQGNVRVAAQNLSNSPGVEDLLPAITSQGDGTYAITWLNTHTVFLDDQSLAIFQFAPDSDSISIIGSADINLDLSAIINVGGDVTISGNQNLVTVDLHNLVSVGGNFVLSDNGALLTITLPSLTSVGGDLTIENNASAGVIDVGFTSVGGDLTIDNNASATEIDVGGGSVGGDLTIENNASAGVIDVGSTSVGGDLTIDNNASAGVIDVGSTSVGGDLTIDDNAAAGVIDVGAAETVGGTADISGNTSVITIDLGALIQAGAIIVANNGVVTLNLSALVTVGGSISISDNHSLLSIDMPELTNVGGDLDISNNAALGAINVGSTAVGGDLTISNNDSASAIDVGATSVGDDVNITDNDSADVIDVGSNSAGGDLNIGGDLVISNNNSATTIEVGASVGGYIVISNNDSADVINVSGTNAVGGDLTIDLAPDATVDASALGPGGGMVHVIGDDARETTVILGSLAQMQGTLTITTADGVTLTSAAGLGTITLTGTAAGNTLIGSLTAKNVITSGGGNDTATGGNNDDLFTGGLGDDTLDGKGGTDTAVYSGNLADYSVVRHADGSLTVTDTRFNSPDGIDTLSNFELFQFADGIQTLAGILPAPVITSNGGGDSAQASIAENIAAATLVSATDPNAVGNLEFTIAGGVDGGKFHIDKATGALSFTAAPDFEHPTDAGGNNVYDVIVQVSDGFHTDSQALAISITNANETPVLANQTAGQSATTGTPFSLTLPANTFQDPDAGDHLTLAATLSNGAALPAWLAFNPLTGAFSGSPGTGDTGSFDVKVTATDTSGLSAADVFHFSVSAGSTNHAPVITSDLGGDSASVIITDDTRYVATVHASDPDPGAAIAYSIIGGADQKLFTIDPKTGVLTFKTTPQDGHSYNVTVAASDGSLHDTQAIKVQVANGPFEFGNAGVPDTFEFRAHFGLAVVSNFDPTSASHDVLELDHALFRNADPHSSPAAIFDLIADHSFQIGHDVVIVTDTHDIIDLRNTNLHSLTAGDFLLV